MGRKRKSELLEEDPLGERPRNAANERERERMRVLSRAFSKLKTTLPWVPPDTKLSKLDTLRLATCYIGHLRHILATDSEENGDFLTGNDVISTSVTSPSTVSRTEGGNCISSGVGTVHPMNLTWPYSFTSRALTSVNEMSPYSACSAETELKTLR